jgi:hypothetical protein
MKYWNGNHFLKIYPSIGYGLVSLNYQEIAFYSSFYNSWRQIKPNESTGRDHLIKPYVDLAGSGWVWYIIYMS